jgi:hypothetical protein
MLKDRRMKSTLPKETWPTTDEAVVGWRPVKRTFCCFKDSWASRMGQGLLPIDGNRPRHRWSCSKDVDSSVLRLGSGIAAEGLARYCTRHTDSRDGRPGKSCTPA